MIAVKTRSTHPNLNITLNQKQFPRNMPYQDKPKSLLIIATIITTYILSASACATLKPKTNPETATTQADTTQKKDEQKTDTRFIPRKQPELPQRSARFISIAAEENADTKLSRELKNTQQPEEQQQIRFLIDRNEYTKNPENFDCARFNKTKESEINTELDSALDYYREICTRQTPALTPNAASDAKIDTTLSPWIHEKQKIDFLLDAAIQAKINDKPVELIEITNLAYNLALNSKNTANIADIKGIAFTAAGPEIRTLNPGNDAPLARAVILFSQCLYEVPEYPCNPEETITALNAIDETARAANIKLITDAKSENRTTHVVALLPYSGAARRIGRAMMGSIFIAQNTFTTGDSPLTIHFVDTKSDPEKIENAFDEIRKIKPAAIIGPVDIKETARAAIMTREMKIPMIAFGIDTGFVNEYAVSITASARLQTQQLLSVARNAENLSALKIAIVAPDSKYAKNMAADLKSILHNFPDTTIIHEDYYDPKATDLSKNMKQLQKKDFNAVFIPATTRDAEKITGFLAQENIWCRNPDTNPPQQTKIDTRKHIICIGTNAWSPVAENHNLRTLQNAIYPENFYPESNHALEFAKTFHDYYHRNPQSHEALAYDAVKIVAHAVKNHSKQTFIQKIQIRNPNTEITNLKNTEENIITILPRILRITNNGTVPLKREP